MKNLKTTLATAMMLATLLFGTTFAHAGLLISDAAGNDNPSDPCTTEIAPQKNKKTGIIISGLTGIIISGFTGILISDFTGLIISDGDTPNPSVNCGIIISG